MKNLIIMLAVLVISSPAFAQEHGGGKEAETRPNHVRAGFSLESPQDEVAPPKDDGRSVEIPTLVVPVFEDGELLNYIFVSLSLQIADGVDPWKVRGQAHYVRDAMIRAAHHESLGVKGHAHKLDRKRAAKVWKATANKSLGGATVNDVHFITVDSRR